MRTNRHKTSGWLRVVVVLVALTAAVALLTGYRLPWDPSSPGVLARPTDPRDVTVAFAGDVHFERQIGSRLDEDPGSTFGPYASAALSQADLAIVNVETAITHRGQAEPKEYLFRAPGKAFAALRGAGVDVATMANNHAMDYGVQGLADTLRAAKQHSFPVVGVGMNDRQAYRPHQVEIRGQRIAVLGATVVADEPVLQEWVAGPGKPGVASGRSVARLIRAVHDAARDSDVVILYFHWGEERTGCPTDAQRRLADAVIKAGADVVVGTHAHRLQGGGWHRSGAYVDYGLGNFVFYADGVKPSTESGVLTLTLRAGAVRDSVWTPARIDNGVPSEPSASDAAHIAARKDSARDCTNLLAEPVNRRRR